MKVLYIFGSFFLICNVILRVDAQVTYVNKGCVGIDNGTDPNFTLNLSLNLIRLIVNLTSEASAVKFYNATVGDSHYFMYGLYQCRDDLSLDNCNKCISDAMNKISQLCTNYVEAIVWYEECTLRYSARSNFSTYETSPSYIELNASDAVTNNNAQFSQLLSSGMDSLINFTASSSPLHTAASQNDFSSAEKLYCFAQCTPNLDTVSCNACLRKAFSQVTSCCSDRIRVMAFFPSCQLRYDNKLFWSRNMTLAPPVALNQAPTPHNGDTSTPNAAVPVAISLVLVGIALLVAGLCRCLCRYKKRQRSLRQIRLGGPTGSQDGNIDDIKSLESLQFEFKKIKDATRNFSFENKLGQGGFGAVYKGKLPNGEVIAVKRLSKNSEQGISEFKNEVLLVAKLQHRNLVKLIGFCVSGNEQILIYEFLSNSSLDRFLYDPLKRECLEWDVRFKIIIGVARGLQYLHEDSRLKIIHRDLKPSNILLDDSMSAKIADFGLAKLFELDQTQGDTKRIAGTYGYMAPEYAMAGQFSTKSDVYSFGVIVLEIVSGQRHGFFHQQTEEGLIHRAWRLWNEDKILEIAEPMLGKKNSEEEVKLCVLIALLCIQEDATQRPRMTSIVSALNGQSVKLPVPNAPHFFTISAMTDATTSSKNDTLPKDEVEWKLDHGKGAHSGATSIAELSPR